MLTRLDRPGAPCGFGLAAVLLWSVVAAGGDPPPRTPSQQAGEDLRPRGELPAPGFLPGCLALIERGRYDEARALLEPVVADHPGWARAHFYLALTYHMQHRYEPARALFRRTLELDPEYDAPRVYYGWSLYYLGRLAESRAMFESYLAAKPGYPDAIFALGLIEFDDDAIPEARSRFAEAIRLAAERGDTATEAKARARLADCHVRAGELSEARKELERSIDLNPDNYEPYFKLSRVLERLGDTEGAERARKLHEEVRARSRSSAGGPGR